MEGAQSAPAPLVNLQCKYYSVDTALVLYYDLHIDTMYKQPGPRFTNINRNPYLLAFSYVYDLS